MQIDALSGFHQLGSFLGRVESGPQPMRLRSLRLSGNPKDFRRHNSKIILIVYFAAQDLPAPASGTREGQAKGS